MLRAFITVEVNKHLEMLGVSHQVGKQSPDVTTDLERLG
jgi:hypothetical protein